MILFHTDRLEHLLLQASDSDISLESTFLPLVCLTTIGTTAGQNLKLQFLQEAGLSSRTSVDRFHINLHHSSVSNFLISECNTTVNIAELDYAKRSLYGDVDRFSHLQDPSTSQYRLGRIHNKHVHTQKIVDSIYYQLMGPFSDVFCIFADNIGLAASQILNWISFGPASISDQRTKPAIVIVLEKIGGSEEELKLMGQILIEILRNRGNQDPLLVFSSIQVTLLGKTRSNYKYLHELVVKTANRIQLHKKLNCMTFSLKPHTVVFID